MVVDRMIETYKDGGHDWHRGSDFLWMAVKTKESKICGLFIVFGIDYRSNLYRKCGEGQFKSQSIYLFSLIYFEFFISFVYVFLVSNSNLSHFGGRQLL